MSSLRSILILLLMLSLAGFSAAQTYTILHAFSGSPDGSEPGHLAFDRTGSLFGATTNGGLPGQGGTIFKLAPKSGGGWSEIAVYKFMGGSDGRQPYDIVFGPDGNLYGAFIIPGNSNTQGALFQLTATASGPWQKRLIYQFNFKSDGGGPRKVVFDGQGNLYGVTSNGGSTGEGTVFKLTPTTSGPYLFTLLHTFTGIADGGFPYGSLAIDSQGNLYGTTSIGGAQHEGTFFKLTPSGTFSVLYSFGVPGGAQQPVGELVFDSLGNLYGASEFGGATGFGAVFQLSPNGDGSWSEQVLHSFVGHSSDGEFPFSGVTLDSAGNIYGATEFGGGLGQCGDGGVFTCGAVYKLTPNGDGTYSETVLHSFAGFKVDGSYPESPVLINTKGVLYSTTTFGGGQGDCRTNPTFNSYCGVAFQLKP